MTDLRDATEKLRVGAECGFRLVRDLFRPPVSGIVARALVLLAGIAESDQQFHRVPWARKKKPAIAGALVANTNMAGMCLW